METFPIHRMTRSYSIGTPHWRIVDPGVASMRLGNGVLRSRDLLGQAIWAIDLRIEGLTASAAAELWAFYTAHERSVSQFYWGDPLLGPLAAAVYETFVCRFDPGTPPAIRPASDLPGMYDADVTILPILPTASLAMLAAQWKMNDEAADTVVADATGNGRTGTASHNTSTMTVTGKVNAALEFITASSRYISVADHADLELTDGGTIMMWVKWDGTTSASGGYSPSLATRGTQWRLYMAAGSGQLGFITTTGSGNQATTGTGALVSGTWRHVALVLSAGASGTRTFFVDGVDATLSNGDGSMPGSAAGTIYLGSYNATGGFFGGALDDVRIYKRPLTAKEIQAIYNAGTGTESEVVA